MFGPSKSEQVGLLAHDCCGVLAQVEPPLDYFQGCPALVELSTAHSIIIVHFDDSPQGFGHPDHALRLRRLEHCSDHTFRGFAIRFASIFSAQIKWLQIRDGGSPVWHTSHLLAHPIVEAEHCAGSSSGALHIPHTTKRIGRLLGSEMAVKADERERDFALSVHGRNDPPQAVPCISKQLLAQRLPCGPPLEPLEDLLQPDLLPLVFFSSMSTDDQSPLISAFRTVSTTFSGRRKSRFRTWTNLEQTHLGMDRGLSPAHAGFVSVVPQKAAVSSKLCRSTMETSWINV